MWIDDKQTISNRLFLHWINITKTQKIRAFKIYNNSEEKRVRIHLSLNWRKPVTIYGSVNENWYISYLWFLFAFVSLFLPDILQHYDFRFLIFFWVCECFVLYFGVFVDFNVFHWFRVFLCVVGIFSICFF